MKRRISSIALLSLLVIALAIVPVLALTVSAAESGTWTLVEDVNDLQAGDKIVIACNEKETVAGALYSTSKYLTRVSDATFSDDKKTIDSLPADAMQFTLGGSAGAWTITDSNGNNISYSGSDLSTTATGKWDISISDGTASIATTSNASNKLQYNASSPRFKTYTSNQTAIQIYKFVEDTCEHTNTTTTTVDATCTDDGSKTTSCVDCGKVLESVVIDAKGHQYLEGSCFRCGEAEPTGSVGEGQWLLTDIGDIKSTDVVVITMTTSNGTTYAIPHSNGSSSAPGGVIVTVDDNILSSDDITDEIKWNITNENGTLTIYPNGSTTTWLYTTASNNGVRVGTNASKTWTIDATSGYLKHTGTNRYLGVYTANPDWRAYTNTTGNTANQTLGFYVLTQATEETNATKISAAQLQIDDTLAIKYLVTLGNEGYEASDLAIRFTYGENGDVVTTVGNG